MLRPKTIAAIELNENQWKLAIASPDLTNNRVVLEHIGTYSNTKTLKQYLSKYNISNVIYSVSNQYSSAVVTNPLNDATLEAEKNACGVSEENGDYFNFGNSSILVALPADNIVEINEFHKTLGLKTPYVITQSDIALGYNVVRNYPSQSRLTLAIANFTESHIGLCIFQNGSAKRIVWHDIKEEINVIEKVVEMLKSCGTACEQPSGHPEAVKIVATYETLYIAGNGSLDLGSQIKQAGSFSELRINDVELLDSLRSPLIDIHNLPANQKTEIESHSSHYSVVLGVLGMGVEGLGLDLTLTHSFDKTIPVDPEIKIQGDPLTKLVATVSTYAQNITPALMNQKPILVLGIILAIVLCGYRAYSTNDQIAILEKDYSLELEKQQTLNVEKTKYEELQKRNKVKNDRVAAIRNIQRTQMLVPTILADIQGLLFQSQFRDLVSLSQLKINGSEVRLSGTSIDKVNAIAFVTKLQNRSYEDVIPTRYTALDSVRCTYELTTRYNGEIPTNPITLPAQSQLQLKQVSQTEVNTNQTNPSSQIK